jgi:hypothetical protein
MRILELERSVFAFTGRDETPVPSFMLRVCCAVPYLIATALGGDAIPPSRCSGTDTIMNS